MTVEILVQHCKLGTYWALWVIVYSFGQVQKASGAYIMSARKQSTAQTPLHSQVSQMDPMSPLPMADLGQLSSAFDQGDLEGASDLAEDEAYAAEEHAHRWFPHVLSTHNAASMNQVGMSQMPVCHYVKLVEWFIKFLANLALVGCNPKVSV